MVLRNHSIGVSHRLIFEKSEADRHTTLAHLQFLQVEFYTCLISAATSHALLNSIPSLSSTSSRYSLGLFFCHFLSLCKYKREFEEISIKFMILNQQNNNRIILLTLSWIIGDFAWTSTAIIFIFALFFVITTFWFFNLVLWKIFNRIVKTKAKYDI